jgi:OTU domain-containing protein 5
LGPLSRARESAKLRGGTKAAGDSSAPRLLALPSPPPLTLLLALPFAPLRFARRYSSSSASAAGDEPIRLAYRDGNHFDAIVDPLLPTAGLGLGLPGLQPGLADRSQMQRARELSDAGMTDELVRRKMLMVTDEEETQREIERSIMM